MTVRMGYAGWRSSARTSLGDGDPPAAYRYTEAKMSKISTVMLTDIDKETVDFGSNYDDRLKEPSVLPSRFPNILVNGSTGIAVGMATNIPPHNLGEVIDAVDLLLDHPDANLCFKLLIPFSLFREVYDAKVLDSFDFRLPLYCVLSVLTVLILAWHLTLDEFPGGECIVHLLDEILRNSLFAHLQNGLGTVCQTAQIGSLLACQHLLFSFSLGFVTRISPLSTRRPISSAICRSALPRWLIRSFSSSLYSAKLRSPI